MAAAGGCCCFWLLAGWLADLLPATATVCRRLLEAAGAVPCFVGALCFADGLEAVPCAPQATAKTNKIVIGGEKKQAIALTKWLPLAAAAAAASGCWPAGWPAACYCCRLLSAAAGGCWCFVMPRGCFIFYRWTGSSAVHPPKQRRKRKR